MDCADLGTRFEHGWSGTMSLPRVLSINEKKGHEGNLKIAVPKEIEQLRYRPFKAENIEIDADSDVLVEGISGDSLELALDVDQGLAMEFGL